MQVSIQPIQHRDAVVTRTEMARVLDLNRRQASRLVDDGWTPPTVRSVAALAARGRIVADEPIAVLRLGGPDWDSARRIGISPAYADNEIVDAARMWWTGPVQTVVDAGHLLVTANTFAVALLLIEGIEETETVGTVARSRFKAVLAARVDDLVTNEVRVLQSHPLVKALGHRVPSRKGAPLVIFWPDHDSSTDTKPAGPSGDQ
jgi:hypothetical protein